MGPGSCHSRHRQLRQASLWPIRAARAYTSTMFGTRRVRPRNNVGNHPTSQSGLGLQSSAASSKPRSETTAPALVWYQRRGHLADPRLGSVQAQPPSAGSNRGGVAGPLNVYTPLQEAERRSSSASDSSTDTVEDGPLPLLSLSTPTSGRELVPTVSSEEILRPVKEDMEVLAANLRTVVGKRHPLLMAAAQQIFGAGGKKLRPAIVLLVARATSQLQGMSDIVAKHRRLAEITEMIHTASLVHDDVVDDCNTRRGKTTVNSLYGTRVAVLAGDFLFAQSSWYLANLDNLEVIKLISQVIADFADGEIGQQARAYDTKLTISEYMDKSFYKTATLIAASCKGAAVFSDCGVDVKNAMFEFGRHLGLAFQVVDDILDFTQSSAQLGKPQGQDLRTGNLTAPAVYALKTAVAPELRALIEGHFANEGDLQHAMSLIKHCGGIDAARQLARQEADQALTSLSCLPPSASKRSLELMVDYVLDRLY